MSPLQAIQILDQAASLASLNRESHVKVQEAVALLHKYIEEKEKAKEEKK